MATTTHTADMAQPGVQPKTLHAGAIAVRSVQVFSGVSLSDHLLLMKIPNGATIVDAFGMLVTASTGCVIDVGLKGVAQDNIMDGLDKGALVMDAERRLRCSVTDDAPNQFRYVYATAVSATHTVSYTIDLTVVYTMDQVQSEG